MVALDIAHHGNVESGRVRRVLGMRTVSSAAIAVDSEMSNCHLVTREPRGSREASPDNPGAQLSVIEELFNGGDRILYVVRLHEQGVDTVSSVFRDPTP